MTAPMRDLIVRIRGNADEFDAVAKSAGMSARVFERELRKIERAEAKAAREAELATQRRHQAYTEVGTVMATAGAAALAGLGLATKAAIDWETAWAGVSKTVGGNAQQMGILEEELRNLAQELPATHQEIAAVAEAAGALGIKRENIVGFTRTMIDLGETTDLTADQAATALARIANVMGTGQDEVDRFGAALVELGNNGASTESEIVTMAQRISGAAKQVGLSEGELLGVASALSSVGIEAEAGGSSFSTFLIRMTEAVNEGGEKLEGFAAVAGLSADEFATKFRDDAAGATVAFVEGLGRIQASGGDTFGTLEALGLSEIRLRDALLRTAGAGDLMAESIATGNRAWGENSALIEEAAKRYGTTASQMEIARNQLNDFGITIGETFLPLVGAAADRMGAWMDMLGDLPEPVAEAASVLGALAGAAGLVGGAALIAVPKIAEFRGVLDAAGGRAAALNRGLGSVGRFLTGPYGLALGAITVATLAFVDSKAKARAEVQEFSRAIEADSGALGENTQAVIAKHLADEGLIKTAEQLGVSLPLLAEAIMGNERAFAEVNAQLDDQSGGLLTKFERFDAWLTDLIPGASGLTDSLNSMSGMSESTGMQVQSLSSAMADLRTKLEEGASQAEVQAEVDKVLAAAAGEAGTAAEGQAAAQDGLNVEMQEGESSADKLKSALDRLTGANISATEAEIRYRDAVERLTGTLGENGATTDLNTDAGRRNTESVIDAAKSSHDYLVALYEQGAGIDEVRAKGVAHREQLIAVARQFGLNRDEAIRLIDTYHGVPEDWFTDFGHNANGARGEVDALTGRINAVPTNKSIRISADGSYFYTGSGMRGSVYASGGVLPGYTPGRDVHDYYAADGMSALHLSGGEAIMRPEWTRAVGPGYVDAANAAARRGGAEGVREFIARTAPRPPSVEGIEGDGSRFAGGGIYRRRFATGGVYQWAPDAIDAAERDITDRAARDLARRIRESGGNVLAWARTQAGKPYIWGGVGPRGYDCSGLLSALVNVGRGRGPHSRVGATGNFPWAGFRPGIGPGLSIGSFRGNPGHMAGTVAGVNVESSGGVGVRVGGGARGASDGMFNTRAHLPMGFDGGGIARGRGWMYKDVIEPEEMLSAENHKDFRRLLSVMETQRGMPLMVASPAATAAAAGTAGAAGGAGDPRVFASTVAKATGRAVSEALAGPGLRIRIEDDGRHGMAYIVRRQERTLARQ